MRTAVDAIAERTGLTFTETGAADAPLRLMWSDEARDEALRGGVVGVARTRATATTGAEVLRRITGSTVVLDRGHALRQGHFDSGSPSWGQVITHEVLHGLGLAHASGREQVMYPSVSGLNHRFGAGDLTGMVRIGAAGGCLT
ncbi:matrixin family metalloprotease [Nocardioides sp. TF02-7]|uniref:matrixin family metalloprotease n=1 Tax=Nocardioides sp. TF02-7 TaxID=2917724 RepID=UPI001F05DC8C|nr:matrixin family metalloprotease [Nocardioides sp. TF02-7]UMG94243.1 matrixin family metalloprotease [Nocardioides sp. TF02-7]